jgi:hypothetical protein
MGIEKRERRHSLSCGYGDRPTTIGLRNLRRHDAATAKSTDNPICLGFGEVMEYLFLASAQGYQGDDGRAPHNAPE